ncbi:zinc finger X-chromosomal protein-like [Penaeus japonicus]|uniref:zinc finger X-chromosomal protein-like n=1 Tax=Penaeus japonicus TaxID=27405 RepID=UPI001C715441|nr:zinc finger X-chromosomal protein-like [Penaeus japonicus]
MSNPIGSFLVRAARSTAAGDPYEGEPSGHTLPTGAFLSELTTTQNAQSFLTETPQAPSAAFLAARSGPQETILSLTASGSTGTFLSSAESDVTGGEEVLLGGGDDGDTGEIASGPLLYLDPATGLHVLVHHLPHSSQESSGTRVEESSHEQFVVVGALQSEEEQVVLERPLEDSTAHSTVNVENMLRSQVESARAELTPHHIFASQLESSLGLNVGVTASDSLSTSQTCKSRNSVLNIQATPEPIEDRRDSPSILDCTDASMLTLRVTDEGGGMSTGELRRDILGIESVPHINLEEIIEKFTSSSSTHHVIDSGGVSEDNRVITDINSSVDENASPVLSEITVYKDHPLQQDHKLSLEKHIEVTSEILQGDTTSPSKSTTNDNITRRPFVNSRTENDKGQFLKLSSIAEKNDENDTSVIIDEESLYDIVMTYRCKLCSEVFVEKAGLLEHYKEIHKPGGTVKIRVSTTPGSDQPLSLCNEDSKLAKKKAVFPDHIDSISEAEEKKDLNILYCGFCSKEFLDLQECRKHIKKEHPAETEKKTRKGHARPRNSQGLKVKYPSQPGMLIGHRKSRSYVQEDNEEKKSEGVETSKRRVRAPKNLQEQYWLQKQKPKPVFSKEVKKIFKCPVHTCKYKFSSEENLQQHKACHGQAENGEERVFICNRCFLKYDKWAMCQLHLWKAHELDIDLLTCGICHTYKTPTEQRLVTHQMTHSDRRDHVCKTCGKSFRQQAQLLNHQVVHVTSPSSRPAWAQKGCCPECKRWFTDKKSMRLHINAVHMKVKPHACPHCSYRCSRKFDLNVHMRQHTGERPHKCELCGWQCRDHNAMRRHKVIHLHMKPLKCPHAFCQFESRHSAYFKRHVSKKHPKAEAIYKCQICLLETPNLTDYITHSSNHEKQLVKEAFKMRNDLPEAKKENENEKSPAENPVINANQSAKVKTEAAREPPMNSTTQEISPETIMFETVTTANDDQNTQVITIKLEDMEETRVHDQEMGLLSSQNRLESYHKGNESCKTGDCTMAEEDAILNPSTSERTVLGIVDSSNSEATVLSVNGDQTLMSLPQVVLSEDGHQYIIGITPDGLSANEPSIFALQQTEEQQ